MKPIYFLDESVISDIFFQNSLYLIKLLFVSYIFFYYIPRRIFPQPKTTFQIELIVINMIYMVAYLEIFVTLLIFLKIFSIPMFLILLVVTKFLFMKFYDKKEPLEVLNNLKTSFMISILDILDNPKLFYKKVIKQSKNKILNIQQKITFYNVLRFIFYFGVILYIFVETMTRGLESVTYAISDTAQFVDWVNHLQQNILYAKNQAGADMYGISILIFFIYTFTNIDIIILFSIYPILLFIALYLAIFYVLRDFTKSNFVAIFGVMFHGIILMSPLADYLLGTIVSTTNPAIVHYFGFSFYTPTKEDLSIAVHFPFESYKRYISAMAYEHSSVFVLLNSYFFIKYLSTKEEKFLLLYTLTLFLVFTFHGGGAIILIFISLLITFNSIIFRKLDIKTFKKGFISILIATIFGNLWMLSVLKYGIPEDFGAAAPFLDKIFNTKNNSVMILENGISKISFIALNYFHYFLFILLVFIFCISIFRNNRFQHLAFLSIIVGIFIVYFAPIAGFPLLASYLRLGEYYFFAVTLLITLNFYYLVKFGHKIIQLSILYILFILSILIVPKWITSPRLLSNINFNEWNSIPEFIVKIDKENQRYSWTLISYVQDYPKVRDKAYHINSAEFLMKFSPIKKYLEIPTQKVYIIVENFIHPYKGLNEWYYRWRFQIQTNLKSWIANYQATHNNIKIAYNSLTITIYEIDNREYMKYLKEKNEFRRN